MEIVSLFHFLRLLTQKRNSLLFSTPCLFWSLCNCLGTEKNEKVTHTFAFCASDLVQETLCIWLQFVSLAVCSLQLLQGWNFALSSDRSLNLGKLMRVSKFFTEKLTLVKRFSPQVSFLFVFDLFWMVFGPPLCKFCSFTVQQAVSGRSFNQTLHPSLCSSKYGQLSSSPQKQAPTHFSIAVPHWKPNTQT